MIGCLGTRVRKEPIIVLYFELENELELYNLGARAANTVGEIPSLWTILRKPSSVNVFQRPHL